MGVHFVQTGSSAYAEKRGGGDNSHILRDGLTLTCHQVLGLAGTVQITHYKPKVLSPVL